MMAIICSSMRVQVVMVSLMVVTHAADVSSTIFQNVYCSCRSDLSRSRVSRRSMTLTMSAAGNALVLNSQVSDLWEESLLRTHWELFVVQDASRARTGARGCSCSTNAILILEAWRSPSWSQATHPWNGQASTSSNWASIIATHRCTVILSFVRPLTEDAKLLWLGAALRSNAVVSLLMRLLP